MLAARTGPGRLHLRHRRARTRLTPSRKRIAGVHTCAGASAAEPAGPDGTPARRPGRAGWKVGKVAQVVCDGDGIK